MAPHAPSPTAGLRARTVLSGLALLATLIGAPVGNAASTHPGIKTLPTLVVYYVALSPAASGGGSCGAPDYNTIQDAVTAAESGIVADYVIRICAGRYDLSATVSATIDLTFTGDGAATTIVDGANGGTPVQLFSAAGHTLTMKNLTLRNAFHLYGGAIDAGTVTVTNSTFSGNRAGPAGGGAISATGTVSVTNSTFSGNSTSNNGGAIYAGTVSVTNSTFSGNSNINNGGAIYATGTVTVANSTFSGNSAAAGGAIIASGMISVTNSTFSGNSASGTLGGAIYAGSSATVTNSILAEASATNNCKGPITDGGGNFGTDASCGFSLGTSHNSVVFASLALGALADNGGPTETIALGPASVAIEAGLDAVCAASPVNGLDERGVARPQGVHCDPGSYEYVFVPPTAPTGVVASPGDAYVLVTWSAPNADGGRPITGYTATAAPGGNTCMTSGITACVVSGLANGTPYTFTVKARNIIGTGPASASSAPVTPMVPVPPSAHITAIPTWWVSTAIPLAWSGTAGSAAVTSYDVRYRRAAWNSTFERYVLWRSATGATSATFGAATGSTYCFSVRARALDGLVSAWTAETCTGVPLDDRSLSRSGSWSAGTGSAYYRSTYVRSSASGARLVRTGVVARRIALIVTTCPTCGSVKVYWGSTLLRTMSLVSRKTVNRGLLSVTTFTSVRTGTLTIKVSSSGHKVIIDGVAIGRV